MKPRIQELHEQIQACAGRAADIRWHSLTRGYDVWRLNFDELKALLVAARDDPNVAIHAASNVPGNFVAERLREEFDRRLHNYVSGFVSLIDQTRRFIEKHYLGTPLQAEYDQRRDIFNTDPVAAFVRDLRNYVLHREAPPYKVTTRIAGHPHPTADFVLPARYLLEWDGWKAPAKAFLNGLGDQQVDVHGTVEQHARMVYDLWRWLFSRQRAADADAWAEYDALMAEYHSLRGRPPAPSP